MAQYERFLSYLFEYEQDTKGANCGFAKIEVRGETKRIQITVKGRTQVELLHVCAFYRDGERCVCVPLGRMMVNGGSGQFQYTASGTYFKGSQVMFSQIKGLVLSNPQTTGRAYATVWDDEPFGLSRFEQDEKQGTAPDGNIRIAELLPGMWRSGEEAGRDEPGTIVVIRREEMEQEKAEDAAAAEMHGDDRADEETDESVDASVRISEDSAEDAPKECEDIAAAEVPDVEPEADDEAEGWDEEAADIFWAKLCRRFQKIESLPGDDMVCLRAVPADIGRLPRANWIFGSNGFLMCSYVRYRYIVFARVARAGFELWVPGTYEKNEEMLARMFGFERFRSMKSNDAADGDFGYWCVPIEVPQMHG